MRKWGRPWAALLALVMVVSFVAQGTSASATTTDWAATANGGTINSSDFTTSGNTIDSNTATAGTYATYGSFCNAYGDAFAPYNRVSLGGGTGLHIVQVHVKVTYPCVGSGGTNGSGVEISCGTGGTAWTKKFLATSTTQDEDLDLSTGGTGYAGGCVTSGSSIMSVRYWSGGNGGTISLYDFRAYDTAQLSQAPISDYCFNMAVGHPSFAWTATCNWTKAFTGSLTWTMDSAGDTFGITGVSSSATSETTSRTVTGTFGPTVNNGATQMEQRCYPLCASDYASLYIVDTTANKFASYTFARSANGLVQAESRTGVFDYAHGCYNVTANQCAGVLAGPAGTTSLDFKWHCAPGLYEGNGACSSLSNTQGGPRNRSNLTVFSSTPYSVSAQSPGAYTVTGLATNTALNSWWMLCVTTFVDHTTCADIRLDFTATTAGGIVTGIDTARPSETFTCDLTHLDGCFKNLFTMATYGLAEIFAPAIDDLRELLLSRQPFAFIVRAADGVALQVSRATAEVTTSSTCPGYSMTLPSPPVVAYTGFGGAATAQPWPSGEPLPSFVVLRCADFEPWGGTAWWQAIRTVMGPAIYLAFALSQLRKLQPTPTVSG